MLVAVTGGMMARPILLLLAAAAGDSTDVGTGLIALGYHGVLFALALTLHRRAQRALDA